MPFILIAVILVLLLLVFWLGSTSYGPTVLKNYVIMSFQRQHPQMEYEMQQSGVSKWKLVSMGAKLQYINQLNAEIKETNDQYRGVPSAAPVTILAPAPTIAPVTVPVPAPVSAPTGPKPITEKFSTNAVHMYGSMHA